MARLELLRASGLTSPQTRAQALWHTRFQVTATRRFSNGVLAGDAELHDLRKHACGAGKSPCRPCGYRTSFAAGVAARHARCTVLQAVGGGVRD